MFTQIFSFNVIRKEFLHFLIFCYCSNTDFWRLTTVCTVFTINHFIYPKTKLVKKASLIRLLFRQYFYSLTKKPFWIVNKITVFLSWTLNKQELIHHIHYFRYIFCHQSKTMEFCWFHKFWYFEFYSSNELFNKTFLYSLWLIIAITFLFLPFAFLCSILSSTKNEYIFGFNPKKLFNCNTTGFIFHFTKD